MPSTLCPAPETGGARGCTSLSSKSYRLQLSTARMWSIDWSQAGPGGARRARLLQPTLMNWQI